MFTRTFLVATLSLAASAGAAFAQPASLAGQWLTASSNIVVEIAPCGQAQCGDVAQVLANNSMQAANAASTAPPAEVGLRILSALRPDGDHWRGRIFNRENGRSYDCRVRKLGDGTLEVRAYVVLPAFGRTQIWHPA